MGGRRSSRREPFHQEDIMNPIKVFVKICSIRNPDVKQLDSIFGTWFSTCKDIQVAIGFESQDSLIDRARSIVASEFLKTEGDVLLFVDDDLIFDPDAVRQVAQGAWEKQTILAGAYRIKNTQENRLAITFLDDAHIRVGVHGGVHEVKYASSGFMAIPRACIQAVADSLPLVDSGAGTDDKGEPKQLFYPMFQPFYPAMPGKKYPVYLSEDYAFCHRAGDLGFKTFIDSRIWLGHRGMCTFWPDKIE
jgi:hypothetical protein